jgi:hypothetical protein
MSPYETLSLLTSLLAAGIATYALVRGHRLAQKQVELQNEQAKLAALQHKLLVREQTAAAKADIRATIVSYGSDRRLVVANAGATPARNLRLSSLEEASTGNALTRSNLDEVFPVSELRPGEEVMVRLFVHLGTRFPTSMVFTWDDDSGHDQHREMKVGL